MIQTGFDKKLTSSNGKITSSKTKYLQVQKKINSLITNDYNFFWSIMYFTSNDAPQSAFINQHLMC